VDGIRAEGHPQLDDTSMTGRMNAVLPRHWTVVADGSFTRMTDDTERMMFAGGTPRTVVEIVDPMIANCVEDLLNGSPIGDDRLRQAVARWLGDRGFTHPSHAESSFTEATRTDGGNLRMKTLDGLASVDVADVSLLVPVYNRRAELRRLLESFGSLLGELGGVVIVDDGSTDGSGDVAAEFGAKVVSHASPGGPARARNAGLSHVDTKLVLMIDSDCTVSSEPRWLLDLLSVLHDESVAIAAPRVQSNGGVTLAERYQGARSALDQGTTPGYIGPGRQIGTVPSAALLARTDVVLSMHGFDASMRAAEDTDFIWRTADAGWRLRYVPSAVVRHNDPPRVKQVLKTHRGYGRWAAVLENKHGKRVRAVRVGPATAVALVAGLSLHPVGVVAAAGAAMWPIRQELASRRGTHGAVAAAAKSLVRGHVGSTLRLSQSMIRGWLPITLVGVVVSRRVRLAVVASLVARLVGHSSTSANISPMEFIAMSAIDDGAHCLGVWEGCVRHRSFGAVLPGSLPGVGFVQLGRKELALERENTK
jgi:mycofactocin glycosyltransferase